LIEKYIKIGRNHDSANAKRSLYHFLFFTTFCHGHWSPHRMHGKQQRTIRFRIFSAMNPYHSEILTLIRKHSGKATQHTFLNTYLGNDHPRYPISSPVLRMIAKEWMRAHRDLAVETFTELLTSLVTGESATEKYMAGILLDYSKPAQQTFNPGIFDQWLDHLVGWAEIDGLCTGKYTITSLPAQFKRWERLLTSFSKSKNINKRRASLVFLCSPLRHHKDEALLALALKNIDRVKAEKEILITKAISWLLRSMTKHYPKELKAYVTENAATLPKIAVRETLRKLKTGKKT
jgi:3-methyladenine DNA glycosylase AlkD